MKWWRLRAGRQVKEGFAFKVQLAGGGVTGEFCAQPLSACVQCIFVGWRYLVAQAAEGTAA